MRSSYYYALIALACALPFTMHAATRTPTAQELAQLKAFGLGNLGVVSDNDFKLLYGSCSSDPYTTLEAMRASTGVKLRPNASGSVSNLKNGIDPVLACRLTKLFEFAKQNGCEFKINSAFRDERDQARACTNVCGNPSGCSKGCAPPGGSCHQYGLAIDVSGSGNCVTWLRKVSPQFELHFPYSGQHIQCKEHRVASCSRSTTSCNGSVQITSDPQNLSGPNASSAPLGLDSIFRNMIGQQQQPAPLSSPVSSAQQQNISSAFSPTPTTNSIPTFINTSMQQPTQGTSTIDLLQSIAAGEATSTGTSTPLFTAPSIAPQDVTQLTPPSPPQTTQLTQGVIHSPAPPSGAFTSNDLAVSGFARSQSSSELFIALEGMRQQLLSALAYLKPFGGLISTDVHE